MPLCFSLLPNTLSSRERHRFPRGWSTLVHLHFGSWHHLFQTISRNRIMLPNCSAQFGPWSWAPATPRTPALRLAPPPSTRAAVRAAVTDLVAPHSEFSTDLKCNGVLIAPSSTFSLGSWFKPGARQCGSGLIYLLPVLVFLFSVV